MTYFEPDLFNWETIPISRAQAIARQINIPISPRPKGTLLIGAGFSKWACGLPLASELFDFEISISKPVEQKRLLRLQQMYQFWRAKHPHANNEEFIRAMTGRASELVNWYITRRLTEPFIVNASRRYTWYINSWYAKEHGGIEEARQFLLSATSRCNIHIVTTNYDLIVEYSLGTKGFNYGVQGEQIGFTPHPWVRPVYATGSIALAKLHGSISWDGTRKTPDSRYGLTGKCLIVPPMVGKQAPPQLRDQWQLAQSLISKSEILVTFGFAFNDYDVAVRDLFSSSMPSLKKVVIIDVCDHRGRFSTLFPEAEMSFVDVTSSGVDAILESVL